TTTYALTSEFHFFFFIHYSPTVIYTLSLHDALPILSGRAIGPLGGGADLRGTHALHPSLRLLRSTAGVGAGGGCDGTGRLCGVRDRKSTRLNSSHVKISYAVFCLKKKKTKKQVECL